MYQEFDHWTATRPWGAFATETARVEEMAPIPAIYAGRPRLVQHSRASIINYDPDLSEPTPRYREIGEPLAALPPTFGPRSILAQTTYELKPNGEAQFHTLSTEAIWPWYTSEDARLMIVGHDPLASSYEVVTLMAFRDISDWHRLARPQGAASEQVTVAWHDREQVILRQKTKLLLVGTDFGRPV